MYSISQVEAVLEWFESIKFRNIKYDICENMEIITFEYENQHEYITFSEHVFSEINLIYHLLKELLIPKDVYEIECLNDNNEIFFQFDCEYNQFLLENLLIDFQTSLFNDRIKSNIFLNGFKTLKISRKINIKTTIL